MKRRRKFSVQKEARRLARERVGPPPAGRVIADRRRKPPKHKKKLLDEEL
jgi:hypothetical protein